MYSQHSIAGHRRSSRPGSTVAMTFGLECTKCGKDYRTAAESTVDAVVVGHAEERQLVACRGVCARLACGSADGIDASVAPLAERVRKFEESTGS